MDWTILGIAPTRDKKAITAAYRGRLTAVNPEDKPEEFKALRGAYEEALRLADQAEAPGERDESPVGLWMERIRALYADFPARIRVESWRELLADPVCMALDTRPLAEEALLHFFLERYHVPQGVWQELDRVFAWWERREELYESYPRDFVDFAVMNGIRYPSTLPYDLFTPGEDGEVCDRYRRLYYQVSNSAPEERGALLEELAALKERHPYGEALGYHYDIDQGRVDRGIAGCQRLAEEYPDDVSLVYGWAELCARGGHWEESERNLLRVLALQPDHRAAKRTLADCLGHTGREGAAKELLFELMRAAGGDRKEIFYLDKAVQELNAALIPRWEAHMARHPEDGRTALELCWCYLQNDRDQEALALCTAVDPIGLDEYDYHRLCAKVQYAVGDYGKALPHLARVEEMLWALDPGCTGEEAKRLARLPEMLQMEGGALFALGRKDEGWEKFDQALRLAPDDPEILTTTAHMLHGEGEYDRAVEVLERLTDLMPGSYHGHFLLAQNLYELGRDRAAFDAVDRALELDGSDLGVYVLKLRILLRNGVWDEAESILDFIHKNGITDDLSVLACQAQLTEFGREDKAAALKQYQAIAGRLEAGESLSWAAEVYYRITVLLAQDRDARKREDRAELLAVLDKALAHDPDDVDCLDYKAWLLKRDGQEAAALAIYHRLEAQPHHARTVERELAELYYDDLEQYADRALHYYELLLDREETAADHFYAGFCCRYLKDWAGAEAHFLREQELTPDDVDVYRGLSFAYEAMGRLEEALAATERAMDMRRDLEGDQSRYWFRKIQILRRMGRWQEAVETVDEVTEKYGCDSAQRKKFEIYCQFGLWAEAQRHLDAWKKSRQKRTLQNGSQVKLDLLTGRYDRARAALAKGEKHFNPSDYRDLRVSMAELDGDTPALVAEWNSRRDEAGELTEYALMNLAQVYWWSGDYDQARHYAQRALDIEDEDLKSFLKAEVLCRAHRILMLAMVGRTEDARAELEKVRGMALCEHCAYCACKDADIFEANIQEVLGNFREAMELYEAGGRRWPDDIDFASGRRRMERRGL